MEANAEIKQAVAQLNGKGIQRIYADLSLYGGVIPNGLFEGVELYELEISITSYVQKYAFRNAKITSIRCYNTRYFFEDIDNVENLKTVQENARSYSIDYGRTIYEECYNYIGKSEMIEKFIENSKIHRTSKDIAENYRLCRENIDMKAYIKENKDEEK